MQVDTDDPNPTAVAFSEQRTGSKKIRRSRRTSTAPFHGKATRPGLSNARLMPTGQGVPSDDVRDNSPDWGVSPYRHRPARPRGGRPEVVVGSAGAQNVAVPEHFSQQAQARALVPESRHRTDQCRTGIPPAQEQKRFPRLPPEGSCHLFRAVFAPSRHCASPRSAPGPGCGAAYAVVPAGSGPSHLVYLVANRCSSVQRDCRVVVMCCCRTLRRSLRAGTPRGRRISVCAAPRA